MIRQPSLEADFIRTGGEASEDSQSSRAEGSRQPGDRQCSRANFLQQQSLKLLLRAHLLSTQQAALRTACRAV